MKAIDRAVPTGLLLTRSFVPMSPPNDAVWHRCCARGLGEAILPPLVGSVHKTTQLWRTGEQARVNAWPEACWL